MNRVSVLIVTGPVGVGKTKTSDEVSKLLTDQGVRNAVIDMDALRWAYPRPEGDPFNAKFGIINLRTVWPNYQVFGVTHLIIPNVIETQSGIEEIASVIPDCVVFTVRLSATDETLRIRLQGREIGKSLEWHENRAVELNAHFSNNEVADVVIDTDGVAVDRVARMVLDRWDTSLNEDEV